MGGGGGGLATRADTAVTHAGVSQNVNTIREASHALDNQTAREQSRSHCDRNISKKNLQVSSRVVFLLLFFILFFIIIILLYTVYSL